MAEVIIGHYSIGILSQGLTKFVGINIKELAGMLLMFCFDDDCGLIKVGLKV